jgi:hypothetical protein
MLKTVLAMTLFSHVNHDLNLIKLADGNKEWRPAASGDRMYPWYFAK